MHARKESVYSVVSSIKWTMVRASFFSQNRRPQSPPGMSRKSSILPWSPVLSSQRSSRSLILHLVGNSHYSRLRKRKIQTSPMITMTYLLVDSHLHCMSVWHQEMMMRQLSRNRRKRRKKMTCPAVTVKRSWLLMWRLQKIMKAKIMSRNKLW